MTRVASFLAMLGVVTLFSLQNASASSLSLADVKAEAELDSFSSEFQTTLALAFSGATIAEEPLSVLEELKLAPILDACHDNRCQQDLKAVINTQWLVHPALVSPGDRIVVSVNVVTESSRAFLQLVWKKFMKCSSTRKPVT
jgi:hypothetical protein